MAPPSSILLLVVCGDPPPSSTTCPSGVTTIAPQPPGPGLPFAAPSVNRTMGESVTASIEPAGGQLLAVRNDGVAHEHRHRDRTDTTGHRRDPAGHVFDGLGIDVTHDLNLPVRTGNLVDADV